MTVEQTVSRTDPNAPPRVLVVDDSATQAGALAILLEEHGISTRIARSGEQALEMVRAEAPDLVLSDVVMPGIDGYEVCRRIKTDLGLPQLPVVLLTSLTDQIAIVRALASGADHYVTKPYDPERLVTRVRQVISRGAAPRFPRSVPVVVDLFGTPFEINASKEKILELLVSSYGDLVRTSEAVRAAEQRARFLAAAGERLSASLDVEGTLRELARLAVPTLADVCIVDIVDADGSLRRVDVTHADPAAAPIAAVLRDLGDERRVTTLTRRAVDTGLPVVIDQVDEGFLRDLAITEEHLNALRALQSRAVIAVPLVARANTLGAVAFVATNPARHYGDEERTLAVELARRAALAMDNARLYTAAQAATRARDDVLAIVSHDLRNPIHTIQMSAALLQELYPDPQELLVRQLAVIRRAGRRANALIQDLLDVSRIESGTLAVERGPLDAQSLVDDVIVELKPIAEEKQLVLEGAWSGAPAEVPGDRDRLIQAFSNLISNAVKFTPAGGRIEMSGAVVNGMVEYRIRDTGAGISAEHLPHLFDRFWQAKRTGRAGAGLGLFITHGIAEAHRGTLTVESVEGQGSTFVVRLPLTA
jgi:signal transduction histidine kinase/DNA-binding response OmpR family regulator